LKPAYEPCDKLLSEKPAQEEVHVWCVPLALPEDRFSRFEQVLSRDERARADRFRFAVHRQHFVAGRGVLRYLLGHYAAMPPAQIQFREGAYGKPALAPPSPVRFNASHSGGLGMYAIADRREVGIDIEQHRTMDDLEGIAKHYFASGELAELEKLAPEDRKAAFFRCWSRKEAFVKAVGAGLSLPLDSFCVSLDKQPLPAIQGQPHRAGAREWMLFDVTSHEGYSAALVTEGMPEAIRCTRVEDAAKLAGELGKNTPQKE
jgi:4'-phosphopantetheinyl transferase